MQSIQVTQKAVQEISRGERRALLLVSASQPFMVGEQIELVNQDASEVVGELHINEVTSRRLKDFSNHKDLLVGVELEQDLDPDLIATKISFSFHSHRKKQQMEGNDVKKYTDITEVDVYGDGGSRGNPGPSAAGWVIYDLDGNMLKSGGKFMGDSTNNQAEYLSLKLGLQDARKLGARKANVYMDSMLAINQMKGIYKVKNAALKPVYEEIKRFIRDEFESVTFTHVPREKNKEADAMVNKTLDHELGL